MQRNKVREEPGLLFLGDLLLVNAAIAQVCCRSEHCDGLSRICGATG